MKLEEEVGKIKLSIFLIHTLKAELCYFKALAPDGDEQLAS
jgi:hypothetical protein